MCPGGIPQRASLADVSMVDMGCRSLAIDPVPDQVAQNRAVDILFVEIIRRQDVPPFFKALDLFGFGVCLLYTSDAADE